VCGVLRLDLSALLVDAVGLLDQTAHDRLGAASVAPVLDLTSRRAGSPERHERPAATLGDATSLVMLAA
jgi:hypothetical protein